MEVGGGGVGGAYGGGKAGGALNPADLIRRPPIILRAVCWLFSVIIFGSISSKGWYTDKNGKELCLMNDDTNACNYGVGISVIAFIASVGFIAGEVLFDQMSSVKTRKHYVLGDMGFSAFWAFLYFVGFCYQASAWGKSNVPEDGRGVNQIQASIAFSFFAIFTWAGCAFFAFQRFRQGADSAFAPSYEVESALGGGGGYSSYPGAPDPDPAYQDPPFTQPRGPGDFQAPTY